MEEQDKESELISTENCDKSGPAVPKVKQKQKKPGIVHLTYIPRYMTVTKVRELMSEFGEVTRLFLKPEQSKKPGKPSKFFCEGWIEFAKRRIAKQVAACLNGTQVGGRRHTPYYDALWSIKYLPKFRWGHLSESKFYEKSRKEQKMRAEIAKVKKDIDAYTRSIHKMKRLKKQNNIKSPEKNLETKDSDSLQSSEIVSHSFKSKTPAERQSSLLKRVFGNNVDE